jgi:GDPmannose 4,6-dehydratase
MWLMLQQDEPGDYVLATGETTRVRDFVTHAFAQVGVDLAWRGEALAEQGYDRATGRVRVEVDPRYFRPTEVECLLGDAAKAHAALGWRHETSWRELCAEMVREDMKAGPGDGRPHGG